MTDSSSHTASVVIVHAAGLDGRCARFLDLPGLSLVAPTLVSGELQEGQHLSLPTMADQVAAGLTEPVHVLGLSMGGMVAQHLALRAPELVRSLVLACTTSKPDRQVMRDRAAFTATASRREVVDDTLNRWFSLAGITSECDGVAYARECLQSIPQATFAEVWRAIGDHDVDAALGRIRVPTTCLAGSADVSTPVAEMSRVRDLLPNARLVVMDGPHMAFLESPQQFARHVRDHLAWAGRA